MKLIEKSFATERVVRYIQNCEFDSKVGRVPPVGKPPFVGSSILAQGHCKLSILECNINGGVSIVEPKKKGKKTRKRNGPVFNAGYFHDSNTVPEGFKVKIIAKKPD